MRYQLMASFIIPFLVGCEIDVDGNPFDPGHSSSGPSSSSGGTVTCSPSDACPAGSWCEYEEELCEQPASATGVCVSASCEDGVRYCGCDGNVYPSSCAAHLAGTHVTEAAHCSNGTFACGDKSCKEHIEVCDKLSLLDGGAVFECRPLPAGSRCEGGIASCECITGYPIEEQPPGGSGCGEDARGNVLLWAQEL
ncbi:uncharacterized protein SOCEGT47_028010 [Sorangium cellulosum]|uniref:Kazal-like domain-containing protein n=2 Tax=Sorangium cellulosum TaxID=56 RepID=A0A4P2PZL3_SORCE|nr:uncharacterized protein SOCEGT47_028010 [Sorangium cellulosum]